MSATFQTLPYERFYSSKQVGEAIRLFQGERLLVLQPFGWHIDGQHIPNAAEHFSRESICREHRWEVVCDFGPYIAVVRALAAARATDQQRIETLERALRECGPMNKRPKPEGQ